MLFKGAVPSIFDAAQVQHRLNELKNCMSYGCIDEVNVNNGNRQCSDKSTERLAIDMVYVVFKSITILMILVMIWTV